MDPTRIVKADFELIIWIVVVVITMIAQMSKAVKQRPGRARPSAAPTPRPSPRPRPTAPPGGDAQQELEDFIRQLTGQGPPSEARPFIEEIEEPEIAERAPPPPPPPPPVRKPVSSETAAERRQRRRVVLPSSPNEPERPRPMYVDEGRVSVPPPDFAARPEIRRAVSVPSLADSEYDVIRFDGDADDFDLSRAVLTDLRDLKSLRKAIVLRELLSPPVALRKGPGILPGLGG